MILLFLARIIIITDQLFKQYFSEQVGAVDNLETSRGMSSSENDKEFLIPTHTWRRQYFSSAGDLQCLKLFNFQELRIRKNP